MSTSFDADLGRANLLRMRGEYRQAADVCLSILKRFPNSLAAHTLLGDIYNDQGQLDQSAQWYELALDLDPSSSSDRHKLEDVKAQIQEREHISSVEQLGLPEKRKAPKGQAMIVVGVALALIVIVVFVLREKMGNGGTPTVIRTPIEAIDDSGTRADTMVADNKTTPAQPAVTDNTPTTDQTVPPQTGSSYEDRALMQQVSQQSTVGAHLISVFQDPRNKLVTLTYKSGPEDDERRIGAMLAKSVLDLTPTADTVTIRSMKDDRLNYTADVPRARLLETENPDWAAKAGSTDAWVAYVLTKEWSASDSAGGSAGAGTGGDQTPPAGGTSGGTANLNDPTQFTGVGAPKGS